MRLSPAADPARLGLCPTRLTRIATWADRLVSDNKLAGLVTMVARRGEVAHLHATGFADLERGTPMAADTIFRIYSMTKPLTSLAILMLYEEGRFQLDDSITRFLPCFRDMRVAVGGARGKIDTVPAERDITFRDLLTHTSGLTYGFMHATLVDALYREHGVDFQNAESSLAEVVEQAAALPLIAQPGREWNYSIATDVLGHLVAVISGQAFDSFLRDRILGPLGMRETGFSLPDAQHPRFAANYIRAPEGGLELIDDPTMSPYLRPRPVCSGGGGLVSTVADYWRFCQLMLNRGELDGVRLLGRKTVALMTANHLRGDMAAMGQPRWSETTAEGIGFGLGFSVMLDPARAQIVGSAGEYAWGGAASTAFWIDPAEDMAVILMCQLMPSSTWPLRRELRVLSYAALID
ncbi:serine hydrolase domain-containing protein [Teichococcus vastitatis]|uniref:Beta-lactamase family protein n=1 Tax=Teichococcus vastitatis TaxID=2307076 RepID=A0ABS9WCV4_9PROT|nr:serine hydrolase domain-containing protein [Pseudoroseomonas vastitatis]MCI0757037.1 beta-lactamase family protein [Pseudoroseomonas vastitatis]